MKNFKKVVAAGLALLMLALSVNVSFAAENYTDKEAVVVAKVNAAGIMTGTDKGFEPSKTLTRAEAAAIIVRMKGISEDTVKQNSGATLFTDVAASHWAAGYVNVASNYGLIKGVGANKFAPEKEVSVAEFYTMAIRALGAGQLVEAEGTWPTNYVNFAIENNIAEDVAQIYTATSTRMTAATIVANTLEANMWVKGQVKSNGEITWIEDSSKHILGILNIKEYKNVDFTGIDTKKAKATTTKMDTITNPEFNSRAGIANLKEGLSYTVWYDTKEKEILGFWLPDDNKTVEFTEIKAYPSTNTGDVKLVVDGEETKYKADSCVLKINGVVATSLTGYDLPVFGVAYYGTTDTTKDKIVKIYAESYKLRGVVKEVTSKKVTFEDTSKVSGATLTGSITIDLDKDSTYKYAVTQDGKEISIEDLEKGDVVFGYYRNNSAKDIVLTVYEDTIEGKVTAKSGSKVTIDGKKYDLVGASANAGDEGTFYLSQNGKIVMFNADKKKSDVAMISAMKMVTSEIAGSSAKLMIKYTDMNGTTSDWVEVSSDVDDYEVSTKYTTKALAKAGLYDVLINGDVPEYTAIGTLVAYTTKGGKFVVKENKLPSDNTIGKDTLFFGITAFTDAKTDTITTAETAPKSWYLTSGVKVFEKEDNNKSTYKKEVTLKEVNAEDLDDLTSLTASYMADLDFDQRAAGVLILEKTNIVSDERWAIVLDIAIYDDGDKDTKEDKQVTVLYAGDSTETTYIAEAANLKYVNKSSADTALAAGDVIQLSVEGDVIKRIADGAKVKNSKAAEVTSGVANNYFVKEYNNNTYTLGTYTANVYDDDPTSAVKARGAELTDTRYLLSEDVVVAKYDSAKTEYKVADFDDIKFLYVDGIDETASTSDEDAQRINDNNLNDANSLVKFVSYTDNDGNVEIVAIIFNK